MLESEYRIATGISYVLYFVSFIIAVKAIPIIEKYLANKFNGLILMLIAYLIAFALMMFVLPKIGIMLFNR